MNESNIKPSEFFLSGGETTKYEYAGSLVTLFQPTGDKIVDGVLIKIAERSIVGQKNHGAKMERTDLTQEQWLVHLQEELMDASIYIEKVIQMLRQAKGGQHD